MKKEVLKARVKYEAIGKSNRISAKQVMQIQTPRSLLRNMTENILAGMAWNG